MVRWDRQLLHVAAIDSTSQALAGMSLLRKQRWRRWERGVRLFCCCGWEAWGCLANAINIRLTALHLKWVMCIAHASKLKCLLIYLTTVPVCSISSKHVWRKFMSLLNILCFNLLCNTFYFRTMCLFKLHIFWMVQVCL